ncbi:MAG: putative Ig domain-containing protein, partial [Nanoarchaeota archaeon]|nr:putative Ig domain-containing protein [Nanoarchaeota archaeon]
YGNSSSTAQACTAPAGYVADNTDCNDQVAAINPGATEICNGIDDNCAGGIDDGNVCQSSYYCDKDADTYVNLLIDGICNTFNCIPAGCQAVQGNDCDDTFLAVNPGATEICNGIDDNCDGNIDENACYVKIVSSPVTSFTPSDQRFRSVYNYDVNAVTHDGGAASYALVESPVGMSIDTSSGLISWVPGSAGSYTVKVMAWYGLLSDLQEYLLKVSNSPVDSLPREKFFISNIRSNYEVYAYVNPGDQLFTDLNFENIGRYNTRYATIRVTQAELGISRKAGPFTGPEIDEAMSHGVILDIPEDAKPGVYSLRISLSDLNGIRRTRYRDFRVVTQ